MGFLEQDLQANRSRNPKFVFFHQPFWIIPLKLGNTDFPFHRMMLAYGVKYVVSGHTHQFSGWSGTALCTPSSAAPAAICAATTR